MGKQIAESTKDSTFSSSAALSVDAFHDPQRRPLLFTRSAPQTQSDHISDDQSDHEIHPEPQLEPEPEPEPEHDAETETETDLEVEPQPNDNVVVLEPPSSSKQEVSVAAKTEAELQSEPKR